MRKHFILAIFLFSSCMAKSACADEQLPIGVVNFSECISESKAGKKEQENMENLRKQISSLVETSEKELREISAKLEDTEYLDSLSPKAIEDLQIKYQTLQEDLSRYQQQFYQVLNHANYQMIQKMSATIAVAAEKIAKEKELDSVINREACFYIRPDLDVTNLVIEEMDKTFDREAKKLSNQETDSLQLDAVDEITMDQAG